jgi:serine/threonine-protein kinase
VHDRGEFEGQLWIAMDYVEGTDAGHLVKAQHPKGMPERDVCAIVTAVVVRSTTQTSGARCIAT